MSTFKELKGLDGIDKLTECVPLMDEIFSEEAIFNSDKTFAELGMEIYKKHTNAMDKLFEILGEKPENSVQICLLFNRIMSEVSQDKDIASFFIYTSKNLKSMMLATANTEGERQEDT